MEFKNKTVIITGAASGMGLLSAQCFAKEGANVLLTDINEDTLIEKVNEINSWQVGKADYAIVDVRDYDQICKARDKALSLFGSIDILINCAGGHECRMLGWSGDLTDMPVEIFDWGIDVNLKGPYYFSHAVLKQMKEQKNGVIINFGSVTGEEGSQWGMAYPCAKAGIMHGLTKSLAQYGAPYGIRAVCVSPGPVLTREAMANMKTLLGRAAQPQEIVDFILYLASDKASFMTGHNYFIDGGRIAMPRP